MKLEKDINHYPVRSIFFGSRQKLLALNASPGFPGFVFPELSGQLSHTYHTPGRLSLSEQTERSNQGYRYRYELTGFLPGHFPTLSRHLAAQLSDDLLVLLLFDDEQIMLLGNSHSGAAFGYSQSQSAQGAELRFDYQSRRPAAQVHFPIQFQISPQGMLQQLYGDANTYTLSSEGMFSVTGPNSPAIHISGGKLLQDL